MIAATGPFTTSDNLEMGALRDLMDVVKQEKPDLLVLVSNVHYLLVTWLQLFVLPNFFSLGLLLIQCTPKSR
jgi:hypothetical protein